MNQKKFSVIVPTKDRTELLRRALNSVQNQNYQNYEVFVCGEGYDIGDEQCAESFGDKFSYYFLDPLPEFKNWGNIQRNEMVKMCTGDYTLWLDDDNDIVSDYFFHANELLSNDKYSSCGMLIFKVRLRNISEDAIIPYVNTMEKGFIDTLNVMIRTDIAKMFEWSMTYDADYFFIKNCERYCLDNNIPIEYIEKLIGNHN